MAIGTHERVAVYLKEWRCKGYSDGIPDECPEELERENLVPSYRLIAQAILSNDVQLRTLGFSTSHSAWYNELKRIEYEQKSNRKNRQRNLF